MNIIPINIRTNCVPTSP